MGLGLGSLVNTLVGMNPLTLAQAAEAEERRRLAAQTAGAVGQAEQAGQQYQTAAQAPSPELGLADLFIPALIGNIASVIAQDPSFRERGQERITQSRAALMKARADNLQALRDVWSKKAEAAQRAGDLEAEATARQKQEQISRTYELVQQNAEFASRRELQGQAQGAAVTLEQERQRGDIATERVRGEEERRTQEAGSKLVKASERTAITRGGIDPDTGLVLKTFYQREANKLRISARGARGGDQKAAITSGIIENEIQRIAGESPMDFYLRLKSATHPFETQRAGRRGRKIPKPLFSPDQVIETLQVNLTPEEFARLQELRKARAGG